MHDLEKVIKGWECHMEADTLKCADCPYREGWRTCNYADTLYKDVYDLLKEHEAVTACWSDDVGHWIEGDRNGTDPSKRTTGETIDTFRCTWCGFYQYWKTPYCPNCGAKMEGR